MPPVNLPEDSADDKVIFFNRKAILSNSVFGVFRIPASRLKVVTNMEKIISQQA